MEYMDLQGIDLGSLLKLATAEATQGWRIISVYSVKDFGDKTTHYAVLERKILGEPK